MKCQEVSNLLVAYLDNEVSPSERALIQAHLDECDVCRKELAALSALQGRVHQFLRIRAAQAAPSSQAWSHLQGKLSRKESGLQRIVRSIGRAPSVQGGILGKCKPALAAIVVLAFVIVVIVFGPTLWTWAQEGIIRWSSSRVPISRFEIRAVSPNLDFAPLQPTYLPDNPMYILIGGVKGRAGTFVQTYAGKDWFIEIVQSKATAEPLPPGREVYVNGRPGVLVTGLEGTFEFAPPLSARVVIGIPPSGEKSPSEGFMHLYPPVYPYTDGKQLTWYAGDLKIEMLTNLSEEALLKIAASMKPGEEHTR